MTDKPSVEQREQSAREWFSRFDALSKNPEFCGLVDEVMASIADLIIYCRKSGVRVAFVFEPHWSDGRTGLISIGYAEVETPQHH
jgi:hypothetical protein